MAELFRQLLGSRGGSAHTAVCRPAAVLPVEAIDRRLQQLEATVTALQETAEHNRRVLASIEARLAHLATQHSVNAAVERITRVESITACMPVSIRVGRDAGASRHDRPDRKPDALT